MWQRLVEPVLALGEQVDAVACNTATGGADAHGSLAMLDMIPQLAMLEFRTSIHRM